MPLSDSEIICTFMEPKPHDWPSVIANQRGQLPKWWRFDMLGSDQNVQWHPVFSGKLIPHEMHLGYLWEVEERLTDEQRRHYCVLMFANFTPARTSNAIEDCLTKNRWPLLHAKPEQKIKALAAVLRPIVEPDYIQAGIAAYHAAHDGEPA